MRGFDNTIDDRPIPFLLYSSNNQIDVFILKESVKLSGNSEAVAGCLLEGHLLITRELLLFLNPNKKYLVGCASNGPFLVKVG